jgi:hypothetical protein
LLQAQLPDPFDPMYDFDKQVLKPKQAKDLHVRACRIYDQGKMVKELLYDNEGQMIYNGEVKSRHNYTGDHVIKFTYRCDRENKKLASIDYDISYDGKYREIMLKQEHSESFHQYLFNYNDNVLILINDRLYDEEKAEIIDTKTEYAYDDKGSLQVMRVTSNYYRMPAGEHFKGDQYLDHYANGRLDRRERLIQYEDGSNRREDLKFEYNEKGQLIKSRLSIDQGNFTDQQAFTYYDNGLIKSYTFQDATYEYLYDFMKTAKVNIEIYDDFIKANLFQYQQHNAWQQLDFIDNKASAEIYIPDLEFYVLSIKLPDYKNYDFPIALIPDKAVTVVFKDGKIIKTDNDPVNDVIWSIEDEARSEASLLGTSNYHTVVPKISIKEFLSDMDNPAFIYYGNRYELTYYIYDLKEENPENRNVVDVLFNGNAATPSGHEQKRKYLSDQMYAYYRSMKIAYPLNPLTLGF